MQTIKERPIIFSSAMVHALRDGRKTQAREVIRGTINSFHLGKLLASWPLSGCQEFSDGFAVFQVQDSVDSWTSETVISRHGKPGDLLWVKETWAKGVLGYESQGGYLYKADLIAENDGPIEIKWMPSIHMPREASRIILEITDIRIERLQSIAEEDAIAEGLKALRKDIGHPVTVKYGIPDLDGLPGDDNLGWPWQQWNASPVNAFQTLWDSAHADDYPWDLNPWVWVVDFKNISADFLSHT